MNKCLHKNSSSPYPLLNYLSEIDGYADTCSSTQLEPFLKSTVSIFLSLPAFILNLLSNFDQEVLVQESGERAVGIQDNNNKTTKKEPKKNRLVYKNQNLYNHG